MKTQILRRKIKLDQPLNKSELMAATGIGRTRMARINPPFTCGLCRVSEFYAHWQRLSKKARAEA